jgi:hypothetical protein
LRELTSIWWLSCDWHHFHQMISMFEGKRKTSDEFHEINIISTRWIRCWEKLKDISWLSYDWHHFHWQNMMRISEWGWIASSLSSMSLNAVCSSISPSTQMNVWKLQTFISVLWWRAIVHALDQIQSLIFHRIKIAGRYECKERVSVGVDGWEGKSTDLRALS